MHTRCALGVCLERGGRVKAGRVSKAYQKPGAIILTVQSRLSRIKAGMFGGWPNMHVFATVQK